jgi:hypothetical protein
MSMLYAGPHGLAAFASLGTAAYLTFVIHPTRKHTGDNASHINLHRIEGDQGKWFETRRINLQSMVFDLRAIPQNPKIYPDRTN